MCEKTAKRRKLPQAIVCEKVATSDRVREACEEVRERIVKRVDAAKSDCARRLQKRMPPKATVYEETAKQPAGGGRRG